MGRSVIRVPSIPACARDVAELGEAHAQDWIEVREHDEADRLGMLADFGGEFQDVLKACAVLEGALAGALDDGSIGERIAEGNAEFDDACACFDGGENDFACCGEIGIAAGYVGDERGFVIEVKGHESIVDCGGLNRVPDENDEREGWLFEGQLLGRPKALAAPKFTIESSPPSFCDL